ncbi:MAG: hypothetical protein ACREQT_01035 [Candidatus Binataceae bacterium]
MTDEVRDVLKRYFSEGEIQRLERLGGRVMISLTAPFISKSQREASRKLVIDQNFLEELQKQKNDPTAVRGVLQSLSEIQLRSLCKRLEVPVGSKGNSAEIRARLAQSLEAESFWRRISNSAPRTEIDEAREKKSD